MNWLSRLFPVQTREAEVKSAIRTVLKYVTNKSNDFNVGEQLHILNVALEKIEALHGTTAVKEAKELNYLKRELGIL